MLIVSLVLSAVLLALANLVAWLSGRLLIPCIICCLGAFFGCPLAMFPALMLTGFLVALSGVWCGIRGGGPPLFLKCSLAAMVASHLLIGILSYSKVQERRILRDKYPTESLVQRLPSQRRRPAAGLPQAPGRPIRLAEKNLNELEGRVTEINSLSWFRTYSLQKLHKDSVTDFIDSPGFGITRRIEPRKEYIVLPEIEPITLSVVAPGRPTTDAAASPTPPPAPSPADTIAVVPGQDDLRELHQDSVVDFVNPKGFGLIEDKAHVTGFQAHHFHAVPRLRGWPGQTQRWRIESLELVSLLKHDEPVAFLSKHLPRMDELRDAPTRPLNPFERNALAALQKGEDLQIEATATRIRLLGSIRAIKQCLVCHEGQRGDLLGAFSYRLVREPTRP